MIDTSDDILNKIVKTLENHPEGLTIKEISDLLELHRQTITKYIFELKGAGTVYRRPVGSATLHYLMKDAKSLKA